ncbi:TPA: hypothetical protein DCR49_00810 [Candidatus Delongbacteria bacterium]|nr:MAG: hypothetical protein A2Y39_02860 [Candidatus Delongbacteria bacterium GWF2_40_14]HAQ60539.1 hypothetical protein [Candidatus Delongbacteria bacterium]
MHEKQLMETVLNYLKRNGSSTIYAALMNSLGPKEAKEFSKPIEYALERKGLIDLRGSEDGKMLADITTKGKMYLEE